MNLLWNSSVVRQLRGLVHNGIDGFVHEPSLELFRGAAASYDSRNLMDGLFGEKEVAHKREILVRDYPLHCCRDLRVIVWPDIVKHAWLSCL